MLINLTNTVASKITWLHTLPMPTCVLMGTYYPHILQINFIISIFRDRAPMVQRTLLNLLRLLLGTEHRWCEDPIESAPFIRDRAPMVQRTLLNLLRLLLLGTEHRWCEDPIESAPFIIIIIIRAQARKAQGPIVFLRILFIFFIFYRLSGHFWGA